VRLFFGIKTPLNPIRQQQAGVERKGEGGRSGECVKPNEFTRTVAVNECPVPVLISGSTTWELHVKEDASQENHH